MKFNMRLIAIIAIAVLTGCSSDAIKDEIIRPVKTTTVSVKSAEDHCNFPGEIKAGKDVKIAFRVSGTIEELDYEEGLFVKEGTIIARLDDRDYQLQVDATRAKYNEVKAEVERIEELYDRNSVSQSDYDKAIAGREIAKAKYQSAINQLDDTILEAPFDGYVQNIYFDIHETVSKGLPVISMVETSNLKVEADIPSKTYLKAEDFSSYYCIPEEINDVKIPLELISIRQKSNMNELYKIILSLDNTQGLRLAPGMVVDVNIVIQSGINDQIVIPVEAVFHENKKDWVWLYMPEQKVKKQEVTTGEISGDGTIEIVTGLQMGDEIITAGIHSLKEDQKVKRIESTSAANVGGLL